jgi:hypothetical protein
MKQPPTFLAGRRGSLRFVILPGERIRGYIPGIRVQGIRILPRDGRLVKPFLDVGPHRSAMPQE